MTRVVVRHLDVGARVAREDVQRAETAPILAVIRTAEEGVRDWLTAGQILQRVLLAAAGAGVQASFFNQPIQVSALRGRVSDLLGEHGFPQVAIGLGYPQRVPEPAPRRPLAEVLRQGS